MGAFAADTCFSPQPWSRAVADRELLELLGLPAPAARRVVGFGYLQTRAFATRLHLAEPAVQQAAELGGLFNLGIALFDRVQDELVHLRNRLNAVLSPRLGRVVGQDTALSFTGRPELDLVLRLIERFFERLRNAPAAATLHNEVQTLVQTMFAAEVTVARAVRADGPCPAEVRAALATKSIGPSQMMLLLCRCHLPPQLAEQPQTVDATLAHQAGVVWWLADDLADAAEDWSAGQWSELWAQVADAKSSHAPTLEQALHHAVESRAVDLIADRLIAAHGEIAADSQEPQPTDGSWPLRRVVDALQHAWWANRSR